MRAQRLSGQCVRLSESWNPESETSVVSVRFLKVSGQNASGK